MLQRTKIKMLRTRKLPFVSYIRQNIIQCTIFFIFASNMCILLKYKKNSKIRIVHYVKVTNNISCYTEESNNLPFADSRNFSPPARSIFFHETSCNGGLNSRQACSIESAARVHPKWQINVLFLGPVNQRSLKDGILSKLQEFPNVKIFRINIAKFAEGTPVENMIAKNIFLGNDSMQQASDVMKYVTLFKWGGICIDLDIMVLKPFDSLGKNWATRQDINFINPAVISLSRDELGRNVSKMTIRELQNFRPDLWFYSGPRVITRTLQQFCSTQDLTLMSAEFCNGFEVYDPRHFYPVQYNNWEYYFRPLELKVKGEDVYAHHFWNFLSSKTKVPKDSFYATLAKKYCPKVFEMYRDDFGD